MSRRVEISEPRNLMFREDEEKTLKSDEIRLRAVLSGISAGTELALYRGSSPFLTRRFDPVKRLFVPAESPWPQRFGYDWIGRVEDMGSEAENTFPDITPGSLVHLPLPHGESHVISLDRMDTLGIRGPLPREVPTKRAVFLSQISIALQAVHDAELVLGDRVVVFGMGVLGLLTVQLLRLAGAGLVIAVDPDKSRRETAKKLGAHNAWNSSEDIGIEIRRRVPGFDVAVEFSGNTAALQSAIRSLRQNGRVVAAGFYQKAASELMLGEEWLHNRIVMTSSNRGWGNFHSRYPRWDRARLRAHAIQLLQAGDLIVDDLIDARVPFNDLPGFFADLDSGARPVLKGVVEYEH
jgi:threonine dehydrogenase-like Zn-dependent dehydrogenase